MNLFKYFCEFNKKYELIKENDIIVVGFSGGPDSVFLTEMLLKLKAIINFQFYLVHINHMLRGEDADSDEFFSCAYAKNNNLSIFHKKINILEIASKSKKTFEEVGRDERYKYFKEIYEKVEANKIATAHNKDDQIETFLFKLIRGTSLQGLEGINANKFNIIRPISEIYKKDILNYLNKNEIQYKIDETNFENDYTRNSIRLDLIPFIEKRYNPKFKEKIYSLIKEIRENNNNNSFYFEKYIREDNKIVLNSLLNLSSFNIKKILSEFLNKNNISFNRAKIQEIESILSKQGTKKIDLNSKFKIVKDYDFIYIEDKNKKDITEKRQIIEHEKNFEILETVKFNNYLISSKIYEKDKDKINKNTLVLNLPKDTQNIKLKLRYKKDGDKIILPAPNGTITKKLKDIFINEKIPKDKRDKIPVLIYEDRLIWIIGLKKAFILENIQEENTYQQILFSVKEVIN